jgi:predicted ATP-dependent endonuclease of OLD family
MNIEIKNFGPIEYLVFDLEKDLHLIYGKNAIGKSYAIYCIYCLMKSIKDKNFTNANELAVNFGSKETISISQMFEKIGIKYKKTKDNSIDVTELYFEIIKRSLRENILKEFKNSISNTFSSIKNLKNRYSNKKLEIIINTPESQLCKKIRIFSKNDSFDIDIELKCKKIEFIEKGKERRNHSLLIDGKTIATRAADENLVRHVLLNNKDALRTLLFLLYYQATEFYNELNTGMREIYFLPASRSGLYQALNTFAPIIAELTQNRMFIKNRKIELPALSEPLSDYFIDLSTVNKKNINKEFQPLVERLEETILKGKVDIDEDTRNITYQPEGINVTLNLSEASSMVAELSPLILYLRHIINHKFTAVDEWSILFLGTETREKKFDILFIEEPEAHLHPEVQVALMKVFAELIKYNLKVFITSHSNYMFHELNNIILGKDIKTDKMAVYHLVKTKNGTTQNKDMIVTDEGIEDENFQETSEKLYEERMKILDEVESV